MGQAATHIADFLRSRAVRIGFDAVGFARVRPLDEDVSHLALWLAAGNHAGMGYLERWQALRRDPSTPGLLEGARTVVSLALAYPSGVESEGLLPHLARYARGPDYHAVVRAMLRELLAGLRREAPRVRARAFVDSGPVLERAWAQEAGLGWIGRNGCLTCEALGSYVVLGEVVLTAELEPDEPARDLCGSCRACVEACPTGALASPEGRSLDARRCLSYWTVEAREAAPPELEPLLPLFGCDACQLACPWNRLEPRADGPLAPLERWRSIGLDQLAGAELAALASWTAGTPLERAAPAALRERARALLTRGAPGEISPAGPRPGRAATSPNGAPRGPRRSPR